jgi:ribosome-binding protein aMBF1 (putative translation factor)
MTEQTEQEEHQTYRRDPAELPIGADPDGPRPYDPEDPEQRPGERGRGPNAGRDPRERRTAIDLGRQVRAYRTARGMTQQAVAERLGWDQPTVARLEAGGVSPNLATLALLGERLGVRLVLTPGAGGVLVALEPLATPAG